MRKYTGRYVVIAAVVAGLMGCNQPGTKTGAYVDDSWITTKVKSEMVADNVVAARNISVNTAKGVVTLSGTAKDGEESRKAEQIARSVKGVTAVENHINVQ
jgi:osmotically-inducible protein OsmY